MEKRSIRSKGLKTLLLVCLLMVFGPSALAHLPRLVQENKVVDVKDPEISQAFYARLAGKSAVYEIRSPEEFLLYVNLLVPDQPGVSTDISARIARVEKSGSEAFLLLLEGQDYNWTPFFEPFAGDRYLMGPEFEQRVPAGHYRIEVYNPQNTGRYVLSLGKQEKFTPAETLHTIKILPALKRDFFGKSPLTAYFNLVGLFMLIFGALLAVPLYLLARRGLKDVK